MKKLYTEKQYQEYSRFMKRIANTNNTMREFAIHEELGYWLESNGISKEMKEQIEIRMKKEDWTNQEKIIQFPNKN